MAEEKTSVIQEMTSKPEAHYTEIVDTAWVECAARVKLLHDEMAKAEQLRFLRQWHERDPPREEKVIAVTTRKAEERTAQEALKSRYHAITCVAKNRESSADWLDTSVEDILYKRSELTKQLRSLSAILDKLQAEKEDLQEFLRKVAVLEARTYVEKGNEKQFGINISEGGDVRARGIISRSLCGDITIPRLPRSGRHLDVRGPDGYNGKRYSEMISTTAAPCTKLRTRRSTLTTLGLLAQRDWICTRSNAFPSCCH
ncbi:hypothetical protein HPB51_005883 [Rhipicephalus microplus]|uniref:Uncharacterized protein n=1 Tax=Rhipicephalus microplus TaxID=6941 RepID=A0A9J6D426_RHIMP|nr:hypothetical protein HPB51_005883 [Rhipicephalus microplus]